MSAIHITIATALQVQPQQVQAAITLLDEGATVPFIARYRKEITQGLDDTQLRTIEERVTYLRELEDRREVILAQIDSQGKLTPQLRADIVAAETKVRLEDLYRPYKPKRRTRGQIAIEAGLEPLALQLQQATEGDLDALAAAYLNPDQAITTPQEALDGAKYILMERFAMDAELVGRLREVMWEQGTLISQVKPEQREAGKKFQDYFDFSEPLARIPSHRALAMLRGRHLGILQLSLQAEYPFEETIAQHFSLDTSGCALGQWRAAVVKWTWQVKLKGLLEVDLITRLRTNASDAAREVFADNLRNLLMASPAGAKVTMGLDPGLRTGVKVAVVDATGKLLDHAVVYPHVPQKQWDQAIATLAQLCQRHQVALISIGNGTASRETETLVQALRQAHSALNLIATTVSEAGASVYSASELAAAEFPELDVSYRGAVSIARRLQDPLAELVKIDPKAIGVGQYQHDVAQGQLARSLEAVVEDCVNRVGVDVNTASVPLLTRVAGLSRQLAENIVQFRDTHGAFPDRQALKQVSRLGAKAFEQAAGFLRILRGANPLDASAVHPESYPVVEAILAHNAKSLDQVIGNHALLSKLDPNAFISDQFGLPTVQDIIVELEKPGRDPRPEFKTANFKPGVNTLQDLKPDMMLEGVVTNVTNFGAFVDIGVHQDGLVHISALADRFVSKPQEIVKAGDIVKVKVMEVDLARKRINLTMRLGEKNHKAPAAAKSRPLNTAKPQSRGKSRAKGAGQARGSHKASPFGNALRDALQNSVAKTPAEADS